MLTVSLFSIYNYLLREMLLTFHSRNIEMLGILSKIREPVTGFFSFKKKKGNQTHLLPLKFMFFPLLGNRPPLGLLNSVK